MTPSELNAVIEKARTLVDVVTPGEWTATPNRELLQTDNTGKRVYSGVSTWDGWVIRPLSNGGFYVSKMDIAAVEAVPDLLRAVVTLAEQLAASKARLTAAIVEVQREVDACAHVTDDWAEYTGNSDDQVNWAFAVAARHALKTLREIVDDER